MKKPMLETRMKTRSKSNAKPLRQLDAAALRAVIGGVAVEGLPETEPEAPPPPTSPTPKPFPPRVELPGGNYMGQGRGTRGL